MEDTLLFPHIFLCIAKYRFLMNRDFNDIKIYSLCHTFDKALVNFYQ